MYVCMSGMFFRVELKGTSDGMMGGHAFELPSEAELLAAFQQQESYHQS